jgi:hypothetical protein
MTPLIILGVVFVVLGLIMVIAGIREERAYQRKLLGRPDMREFLTGWPPRSWRHTLTMGGGIGMIVGVIILVLGILTKVR